MAACDVWRQTHKKFYNVLSSATQIDVSESLVQDSTSSNQDEVLKKKSDSLRSSELLSNSIFLNIAGNVIDSYDTGDDDLFEQFVEYWNDDKHLFELRLGEKLHRNIFNDLLFQGQVDLCDDEPDSDQDFDDDIDCGTMCSDKSEDENCNYFEYTHYNCIPTWELERQQHEIMVQNDYGTIDVLNHNVENETCGAHSVTPAWSNILLSRQIGGDASGASMTGTKMNFDNNSVQSEQTIIIDNQLAPVVALNVDSTSVQNETKNPCTFSQQQFKNENHGGHSTQFQQQPSKLSNVITNNKLITNLDLDVIDGIFHDEITLPHGFHPLQEFINTIVHFEQRFGDNIGASISSLNKLKLVFIDKNNAHYVCRPLIMHADCDPRGEFLPLKKLLYVLEDLDIEYGDTIGVSSYNDVNIYLLEKMDKFLIQNKHDLNSSNINSNIHSSLLDINKNDSDLNSLNGNNNTNKNSPFLPHYTRKRGKKKKRYKWVVKNNLNNPTIKTFGKNSNVANGIDNIRTTSDSSSDHNAHSLSITTNNNHIDVLNNTYALNTNMVGNVTARAPPCDPDGKY